MLQAILRFKEDLQIVQFRGTSLFKVKFAFWGGGGGREENRIYIRGEFTIKKCKTAILLYCFHTAAGVLQIFML